MGRGTTKWWRGQTAHAAKPLDAYINTASLRSMPPPVLTYRRAARFRRNLTPPEARLWISLKAKTLSGHRFRRQHPIGPYILDFYCPSACLALEVDGALRDYPEQLAHDARRTDWLARQGVRVLRIRATDIRDYLDGVLALVEQEVGKGKLAPPSRG